MKAVLGIDVGFRTGAWVRISGDARVTYGVFATEAPPPKKQRVAGQLAVADDEAILSIYEQVRSVIAGGSPSDKYFRPGCDAVVYEQPGKGQGARAVETLAFARAAIVLACAKYTPLARVTADESEVALLGHRVEPRPPRIPKLPKGATQEQKDARKSLVKAQKKAKEERRKARKIAICTAVGAALPELANLRNETSDWSHIADAAAVLIAEVAVGRLVREVMKETDALARLISCRKGAVAA